ncbi:PREDICTED: calcium-activated potassium channel subunit beta-4, partial [Tauraco erythrolophus]|uniref:calcium-activated potassium channel subunit beta-4 n=1 Tax=Tauraco erythrolophus TaxID=121530 RepID=UPI0005238446
QPQPWVPLPAGAVPPRPGRSRGAAGGAEKKLPGRPRRQPREAGEKPGETPAAGREIGLPELGRTLSRCVSREVVGGFPEQLPEAEGEALTEPLLCSYIPPCARDDQENSENVTYKQKYWKEKVGSQPFTCYFNQHLRPDDVMLKRTHDETVLLHCFLWPLVTFLAGVLIVILTICAKSLAVRAEAIKKKKHL